jgi:hypothetical protein
VVHLGELIMILDLHRQGLSVSAIARQLGLAPDLIRDGAEAGEAPREARPSDAPLTRQRRSARHGTATRARA